MLLILRGKKKKTGNESNLSSPNTYEFFSKG